MAAKGKIIQVIGSTFDAQFPEEDLPAIYNAIETYAQVGDERLRLVGAVARQPGRGQVRCVSLASTHGLRRCAVRAPLARRPRPKGPTAGGPGLRPS